MMLKDKVAIVTGGTRGIGYAIVHKFLQNGAKVVLFGSREETVAKAVASLKEENPDWEVSGAWPKLTDAAAMVDEINKVKEKYGKIDILVNNAGVSDSTPIDKYTAERFASVMDLNVNAMMNGILPTVAIMKEQGGGKIINMGSQAGVVALDGHLTYGCCKAAVIYATKQFAMELAQYNINVNAISPTIILTPMGEENWNNERGVEFKKKIPAHRFGYPEEVAACAVFLASDASSLVIGANLVIDG